MKECSCVVGLVLSYPDGQSRWLVWVRCVVPGVPEGGLLRVGLLCRAGTFEDVGCGVLGPGFASSYRAVKAVGTINLVPFRLCCAGEFQDGAEGGC